MSNSWYKRIDEGRYKYETTRDMWFVINEDDGNDALVELWSGKFLAGDYRFGILRVSNGYRFDGATCAPDIKKAMPAFLAHDVICQYQCVPMFAERVATRRQGDDFMYRKMLDLGVSWLVSKIYHIAVVVAGKGDFKFHADLHIRIKDDNRTN